VMFRVSFFLSSYKQAVGRKSAFFDFKNFRGLYAILTLLREEGYIICFFFIDRYRVRVYIPCFPRFFFYKLYSTSSRRIFWTYNTLLENVKKSSRGILFVSTSRGVLTGRQSVFYGLGGEPLFFLSF
jgi:ribosomal protein S8